MKIKKMQVRNQLIELAERSPDEVDSRKVELSFSSETDSVERYFGVEILDHSPGSVRLGRLEHAAPVLLGHDQDRQIGVVEAVDVRDGRGVAVVRFSKAREADEVYQDILDGIRRNVSVGYTVHKMREETGEDDKFKTFRATDWEPLEISIVSVPADATVGIGRAAEEDVEVEVEEIRQNEENEQNEENKEIKEPLKMSEETRNEEPQVNVAAERNAAVEAERKRASEIRTVARQFDKLEMGERAISEGTDVADFKCRLLEDIGSKPVQAEHTQEIGMSDKEKRNYSFFKLIRGMQTGDYSKAGFEVECSKAAEARGHSKQTPEAMIIPYDMLGHRAIYDGSTHGAELIQTDVLGASFIDLLRNKARVIELGARVLTGLQGDVSIPKQSGAATGYWLANDNTAITAESALTLTTVGLTPKNLGAYTDITHQMLKQSSVDVEQLVRDDLASVLALALDLAALSGESSLTYKPTGIINTANVNSVSASSASLTWANVVGMETEIATDNADADKMRFLTNAKVRGDMKQTLSSSTAAGAKYLWSDNMVNGYPAAVSNQLTVGTSNSAVFGDFSQLLIGLWGSGLEIMVDPYSLSTKMARRIVAMMICDTAVRHPQAFCKCEDIVTT